MKSIYSQIIRLVSYGINVGLLEPEDKTSVTHSLMKVMNLQEPDDNSDLELTDDNADDLEDILKNLLDVASEKGMFCENTTTQKALFDIKMALLSEIIFV